MSSSHWFIQALSELVYEAKKEKSRNVLLGLGQALEVFCVEAGFSAEEIHSMRELVSMDTHQQPKFHCELEIVSSRHRQQLDA